MEASSQDEDLVNESENNFNSDELTTTTNVVEEQLKKIAESGRVDMDWHDLQSALKSRLMDVLDFYSAKNSNRKEDQYQEPNVVRFNLENSRDEILDLIASFSEAPFTIQRICELLYSPFKYYVEGSTFLRGLEKNLRVISSNDWPKNHTDSRKDENALNNQQQANELQDNDHPNIQIDTDIQTEEAASDKT